MDGDWTLRTVGMLPSEPSNPVRQPRDARGLAGARHGGTEPYERVALGLALAVPGASPADCDLELDRRRQPVEVGPVQQANLDQSHGPRRIATGPERPGNA